MTSLALPPARPKWRFLPMSQADARYWIDSYNTWVEVWNRHETSLDLPLSPKWPEAQSTWAGSLPQSVLAFNPNGQRVLGVIRFRQWRPYAAGWSHCRTPAAVERIVWGGWSTSVGGLPCKRAPLVEEDALT